MIQEQHPLGAVHLLDYSVHSLAEVGKPFSFTVAKFGGMTLHLAAHSEDARNRWGQAITQAAVEAAQVCYKLSIYCYITCLIKYSNKFS